MDGPDAIALPSQPLRKLPRSAGDEETKRAGDGFGAARLPWVVSDRVDNAPEAVVTAPTSVVEAGTGAVEVDASAEPSIVVVRGASWS